MRNQYRYSMYVNITLQLTTLTFFRAPMIVYGAFAQNYWSPKTRSQPMILHLVAIVGKQSEIHLLMQTMALYMLKAP